MAATTKYISSLTYDNTEYKLVDNSSGYTNTSVKGNAESSYRTGQVNLTPANIGALATTGGTLTGDLTLYVASGNSPAIIFQRGTLTDTYNDWKIYDKGGYLYFAQRGSGSSDFTDMGYIDTNSNLNTFKIPWGNVTGKPSTMDPSSHAHGNISNTGTISSTAITPSGTSNAEDYILLSDSSNSGKIERGIKLGTDTAKFLSSNGTWHGIATHSYTKPTGSTTRTANVALNTTTVNSITDIGTLPELTITPTDVVTGGTTTSITPVTSKTVVTSVTPNTVVTGGTTTNIPNVTSVGTMFAASYNSSTETLTLTSGSAPTLGTAIAAYTGLSTGTSASVTTGASINTGTAINAYTSLTTASVGSASEWSAGTLPTKGANTSVATTVKTQPTFTVDVTTDSTSLTHTAS